jgi:hypothetical protein
MADKTNEVPTRTQARVLQWEAADGRAELELQTGVYGVALLNSIGACKRRGWLDSEGRRTETGDAALNRAAGAP